MTATGQARTTGRKVRKRAEREDRILKAAEELFYAKGFAATTIDEIADMADVSKGAVYLHYRTKDDIYYAILSKALGTMRDMFKAAVDRPENGLEKFRAIGRSFYEYTKQYPEYSNLLYAADSPMACPNSEKERDCRSLNGEIGRLMVSSIEEGMRDGSIRPDVDPVAAALTISSSMQGFLRTILREKEAIEQMGLDEGYLVDHAIDLYGRSLMSPQGAGCAPAPPVKERRGRKK